MSGGDRGLSLRPKEDYYLLMLKVNPEKEVVPVRWSPASLNEDSAALIIDEQNERLYIWIGEGVDGITKAIARRKAADVSSQGYKLPNISYPIGKLGTKKLQIVEINQADLAKDKQAKDTFAEVKALFRKKIELLEEDTLARASIKVPTAMRELGGFTGAPPQFQEVSKALEEKFGRAPEIIAERETMRERYKEREYDKVAAVYTLAFVETLGGKVSVEISQRGQVKVFQISKEAPSIEKTVSAEGLGAEEALQTAEVNQVKKCAFTIEDKRLKILENNLTLEEINKAMKKVEELTL
ncbi:MAG: hypothetical protein WED04_07885 [Promethearchaeati archaeon SRVP18_Atabeyarchaeia-1]